MVTAVVEPTVPPLRETDVRRLVRVAWINVSSATTTMTASGALRPPAPHPRAA
jgi:hypothetical protein